MKICRRLKWMVPYVYIVSSAYWTWYLKNSFSFFFADDDGELRLVASHSARGWRAKRPLRKRRRAPPPSLSWARATSYAVYSVSSLNGRPLSNFILFLSYIVYATGVCHSKLSVLWPILLKFLMRWFLNRSNNNVLEFQKCMHLENIVNSRFFECRLR